jgi:hypothetical protein
LTEPVGEPPDGHTSAGGHDPDEPYRHDPAIAVMAARLADSIKCEQSLERIDFGAQGLIPCPGYRYPGSRLLALVTLSDFDQAVAPEDLNMLSQVTVGHLKYGPDIREIRRAYLVQDRKQSETNALMNHIVQARGRTDSRLTRPGILPTILIHG